VVPASRAILLAAIVLAAALRLPALAARPMHADEAVHADKLATLLEGGGYAYDPSEYHGPTLYYLTLVPAWLSGARRYVDLREQTLRCVPAVLGIALVALHPALRPVLGAPAAALAALLAALSPAMVFYSRDYIHEPLLVLFSFGALLATMQYLRRPAAGWAALAGVCAGLMLATKETAAIALAALLGALALTYATDRRRRELRAQWGHVALAAVVAVAVASLLFSSFLAHPRGILDAVRAYGLYLERAGGSSWHAHPWSYYLKLLIHFPAAGTPFWTEALIVVLAIAGAAAGWVRAPFDAGARWLRLLAFYTAALLVAYSAIPYKTPWCVLGFLHGMILLAGGGAVALVRACRPRALRVAVTLVIFAAATQLGWQAFAASFRYEADPRNPYVYAQTTPDVFRIAERVKELARAHPDGAAMPVQVISNDNLWPLPWYLRGLTGVAWWTGVPQQAPSAPVILITPDMEPALVHKLYELPPPGERALYASIFEQQLELRPRVEIRGYATSTLLEELHRREAASLPAAAGTGR
jgi:uncharacterized protein (TIGR03663 family)